MPTSRLLSASFVLALAGSVAMVACSSSSSSGSSQCTADPWQCPAGQTCWPKDQTGNFACLNSAVGKNKGDACQNTPGAPTCGDGMACFQQTTAGGSCVPYCDNTKADHGCGTGEICQPVQLVGTSATFSVCLPTGEPPTDSGVDSGVDSGGSPPDSGTITDTGSSVPPDSSGGGGG